MRTLKADKMQVALWYDHEIKRAWVWNVVVKMGCPHILRHVNTCSIVGTL